MVWANFHTHTKYCDGNGEITDFAEAALMRDIVCLGFSSHAPLPFDTDWTMPPSLLEAYCDDCRRAKREYEGKLKIFLGLEVDYIRGISCPRMPEFSALGLDYVIGSVHFFETDCGGTWLTVDGSPEEFQRGITRLYDSSVRKAVERYYALIREMVRSHPPDIVGHLDLVKKNNTGEKYFSEEESWYRDAVFETLDAIAGTGVIVEVNTGGLIRKRTDAIYPSPWILGRCHELKIPIMLNADAHSPDEVCGYFPETASMLRGLGFTTLCVLNSCGWDEVGFSENGFWNCL